MHKPCLSVDKILVATFAGISFASLLVAQPSFANPNQPFRNFQNDNFGTQSEPNSNSLFGNGSDFNMFDLIHQANFGTLNWNSEEQNQQIDDAAAAFKARQRKLLQTQQQPPANSPITSTENTLPLIIKNQSEQP